MTNEKRPTSSVKVVKVPAGEEPLWVRRAWLKVPELSCEPVMGYPVDKERGALSGKERKHKRYVALVSQRTAIESLRSVAPKAYAWWQERGYPREGYFAFDEHEVEIIREVKMQSVRRFGLPMDEGEVKCARCGRIAHADEPP